MIASALSYLLRHSDLSVVVDRLLGMFFGVLRGAVVIAAFVLLAQFAQLDQVQMVEAIQPDALRRRIRRLDSDVCRDRHAHA